MAKLKLKEEKVLKRWLERDLSAEAVAGTLEPAYMMDQTIDEITEVLESGRCPIIYGVPGVGKSSAIYEIIRRSHQGNGVSCLKEKRILQLSFNRCLASLGEQANIRQEFQDLIHMLSEIETPVVPYFRDLDAVGYLNIAALLHSLAYQTKQPILAEGKCERIELLFTASPELAENFVLVKLEEPSLQKTTEIVNKWAVNQQETAQINFSLEAREEALYLAHQFLSRSHMPRKVIDLLSQVSSSLPADKNDGTSLDNNLYPLQKRHDFQAKKISSNDVIERFSKIYKIPKFLIDPLSKLSVDDMRREIESNVLGQPQAVDAVVRMIGKVKSCLTDARRPIGAFLFAGPTGVGKTHIAHTLAAHLFGSRESMVRINMADYQEPRSALTLFGDPDNFRLRQTEGVLSQRLRTQQFSVLLLDEFEKAHPSVLDRFLQLIDEGSFINGNSEIISCRSLIIIATTNAGSEMYRRDAFGFSKQELAADEIDIEVQRELESCFRFEFLNRFDEIVYFQPLDKKDIRRIASKELKLLEECVGLKRKNLTIEFDDSLLNWLVLHGYDPTNGARFLKRTIERSVIPVLASALLGRMPEYGEALFLYVKQEQLCVDLHSSRLTHFNQPERLISTTNEKRQMEHPKQLPVVVLQARYSD